MLNRSLLGGLVALLLLTLSASASAAPVTIGQLAPPDPGGSCNSTIDAVETSVASGAAYVVPPGYTTLSSWSTNATAGLGQTLTMKVFRAAGGGEYTVVAHDGPRPLNPEVLNTFPVSIPVQPGDIVGLSTVAADNFIACRFSTGGSLDVIEITNILLADGATGSFPSGTTNWRLNISATVEMPPAIVAISPATGSASGGAPVVIAGHDLTGASAVKFGSTPASGFTVVSDNQIDAIAPPSASPGSVDVTVTTAAGTTPTVAADRFSYTAIAGPPASPPAEAPIQPRAATCVVPKLKGAKLKADRKKLKKADCKLGKVKGTKSKAAQVKNQTPGPGKVLPAGSKVNVTLGEPQGR